MKVNSNKGIGFFILLILILGLFGGAIGEALGNNISSLSFLKDYMFIGMHKPVAIDLKLIVLSFSIGFNLNILSFVGMIIGIFIFKKM